MTDLGFQIEWVFGFWITIALIVITATGIAITVFTDSEFLGPIIAICAGICAGIAIILGAIFAFPYNIRYLHLYSVQGQLTNVSTSVQSSDKSISNYYVLTLSGHNEYFVTENPRILDLKGRDVDLVCHANYVYEGQDNYDCNIRSVTP